MPAFSDEELEGLKVSCVGNDGHVIRERRRFLDTIDALKVELEGACIAGDTQERRIERLEKELNFKYGKTCKCGELITIIPTECNDSMGGC